jgi:Anti-sigma-K factor rskA, C-terminal/Putative zinc-finger
VRHDEVVSDLPALLRGELSRARLAEVVDHLEACEQCRLALVSASEGHSAVVAAVRTLRQEAPSATAPSREPATGQELPPLPRHHRRWPRWQHGLVAAVAAVAVTVVVLVGVNRDTAPTQPAAPAVRAVPVQTARLAPVTGAGSGEVTMRTPGPSTYMTIHATGLGPAGPGHFYYAWLLDPATNKMLPLGQVGADGRATFEVDARLVSSYHAVDVSLQTDNGNPGHSDTSVLRAEY